MEISKWPKWMKNIYIFIYYIFALSVCLCLINYASEGHNSHMGHTYEG